MSKKNQTQAATQPPPEPVPAKGFVRVSMEQWHKMSIEEKAAYSAAKEAQKGPPKVQVRKQVAALATKVLALEVQFAPTDNEARTFLSAAYTRLLEACEEIDELPKEWKPVEAAGRRDKSDKLAVGDTVVITDKGKDRLKQFFDGAALDGEHKISKVETSPRRCQLELSNGSYFWFPQNVLQRTRKESE